MMEGTIYLFFFFFMFLSSTVQCIFFLFGYMVRALFIQIVFLMEQTA